MIGSLFDPTRNTGGVWLAVNEIMSGAITVCFQNN